MSQSNYVFAEVNENFEHFFRFIETLPKQLSSLGSVSPSCSAPTVSILDRANFASFACQAPIESVNQWIESQENLNIDLLSMCGHCSPIDLKQTISRIRNDVYPETSSSFSDLPDESLWQISNTPIASERLYASTNRPRCNVLQASYQAGTRSLEYLGTHHFYTLSSMSDRQQMTQTLEKVFLETNPQEVVLEGYPDIFPCERAVELYLSNRNEMSSEQDVIAWLALRNGTRIRGAEPPNTGLTGPNTAGLKILQLIAQMVGPNPGNIPSQEIIIERAISSLGPEMSSAHSFTTTSDFLTWYRQFNGAAFSLQNAYQDITPAPFLPINQTPHPSNIAFHEASIIRDSHALRSLRQAMSNSNRVMAVYGSGHLERTSSTLSSILSSQTPIARCRD